MFSFQPDLGGLLSLAVTVLLPLLVGLVTTRLTSSGTKAVLLLALASITSVVQAWLASVNAHVPFEWVVVAFNAAINFGVGTAVHFGLWKPTGAAKAAEDSGITH
jgi:hypothetical protein